MDRVHRRLRFSLYTFIPLLYYTNWTISSFSPYLSVFFSVFLTTREAAWHIISVVSVSLSVCLFVCLSVCQMITLESLDVGSSYLHIRYIARQYRSSSHMKVIWVKVKVTGAKKVENYSPHGKTSSSHNCSSIKHTLDVCVYHGFWLWRIEWCDRHLCHVTGSNHA